MNTLSQQQKDTLEALIDSNTLAAVLEGLQDVCHAKADHLQANWQDPGSARVWTRAAGRLTRAVFETIKDGI